MKYLISGFCFSSILFSQNSNPSQAQSLTIHFSPALSAASTVDNAQSVTTTVSDNKQLSIQALKPYASHVLSAIQDYVREHYIFLLGLVASSLYAALLLFLLNEHRAFRTSYYWSMWHCGDSIESMSTQSYEQLKIELIKDIARHYINKNNPTDAIWPLTHFMSVIKQEEQRLRRYLTVVEAVKSTLLVRILPTTQEHIAQEALMRLQFVYHIFKTWSADLTWDVLNHQTGGKPCV